MKIAILAAGDSSHYFPAIIDKPKCLYKKNGKIQLVKVIEDAKKFVDEENIIIVTGYKSDKIKFFLKKHNYNVVIKNNNEYFNAAVNSFKKAIENEKEDILFMFADESISIRNIERVINSSKELSIMYHDNYYYYSLGIFKLKKTSFNLFNDPKYLDYKFLEETYLYANKKKIEGAIRLNSGICLGYLMIDLIRRIGKFEEIENPKNIKNEYIDFLYYSSEDEYIEDLDHFSDTDEYKNSLLLRIYFNYISKIIRLPKRILKKLERIRSGE